MSLLPLETRVVRGHTFYLSFKNEQKVHKVFQVKGKVRVKYRGEILQDEKTQSCCLLKKAK